MSEPATKPQPLVLSSTLDRADGCPLPCVELVTLCEAHEGETTKAAMAVSEKGGAKRTRIRPVVKQVNDASAVELADELQAIAWADVCKRGKKTRYVAELTVAGETKPIRVYFDLTPDHDTEEEEDGTTNAPSLEYVRGLEQQVLTLTRQLNALAARSVANEGKRIDLAWAGIDRAVHTEIARGQVRIEETRTAAREARRDKLLDGAVEHILPGLAGRLLDRALPAANSSTAKPADRLRALLSAEQLDAFKSAVGDERVEQLEAAETVEDARKVLAAMPIEMQGEVLAAIGRDHVITISTWT